MLLIQSIGFEFESLNNCFAFRPQRGLWVSLLALFLCFSPDYSCSRMAVKGFIASGHLAAYRLIRQLDVRRRMATRSSAEFGASGVRIC